MKDFFVSYSAADRAWAEWIAWQLEAAGWSVVVQAWDFQPGSNFALEMSRALVNTQRTIAVLSPAFLVSDFTAPEWAATFARDPTGALHSLVPVRVRECSPTGLLAPIVYIDLVGVSSPIDARKRLLDGIKARLKPEGEPVMPLSDPVTSSPASPEPPWPPGLEIAARLAKDLIRRILRIGAEFLAVAMAAWLLLGALLPGYVAEQPFAVAFAAMLWGSLGAVLFEYVLHARRRYAPAAKSVHD
ncbi:MAG TPA: toll/interleukin-1 receptor domain-containing protein [Rubrivivax sp.]|nr:toll/interleukin-1 receptor domain-containing protein [Rubrivivax sp.]